MAGLTTFLEYGYYFRALFLQKEHWKKV